MIYFAPPLVLVLPLYFIVLPDEPLYAMEPAAIQQIQQSVNEGAIVKTPSNLALHHLSTKTTRPPNIVAYGPLPGGYGCVTKDHIAHLSFSDIPTPNILLIRADGKDLLVEHVDALWSFIDRHLKDTSTHFANELTPDKFIRFWENLANGKECPVKRGCKAYGKEVAGLMSCGVCEVVKYCNRECQQRDWKMHKKVCVRKYAP